MNINFPKAIVCKDFKSWYFSHSSFQGEIEWHQRENPGSFESSHDLIFKAEPKEYQYQNMARLFNITLFLIGQFDAIEKFC